MFGPFLVIAFLLLLMWAGGFLLFHVASGLIHLLLLFAVISFVVAPPHGNEDGIVCRSQLATSANRRKTCE
jgi:hypothetical protein